MKKYKKKIGIVIGAIIIILAGVTWFYPYSALSVYKSISFGQDSVIIDGHLKELNDFKDLYEKQPKGDDLTTDRIQYMLQLYELPLLTSKKPVKMGLRELDDISMKLKETRESLIELTFAEKYDDGAKDFLKMTLEDIIRMKDAVNTLKHSHGDSRKTIKIQIANIRGGIMSNFGFLETFYNIYKGVG